MQAIDSPDGLFHDGNPATGAMGTIVSSAWLNAVQGELVSLVQGLGGTLDPAKSNQISALLSSALGNRPTGADLTAELAKKLGKTEKAADSAALDGHQADYFARAADLAKAAAIPAGYAPADGQMLARSLYPDAWAGIAAGNVPTVADATWLSTPTERGKFTAGDGATTFRLPDYNGKAAGSLGAVFQRGDGALSAGATGVIQTDEFRSHEHSINSANGSISTKIAYLNQSNGLGASGGIYTTYASGGTETRPINVTGCWAIRLFGAVTNSGAADAAQLATEVARLWSQKAERQSVLGAGYMLVRDERASGTNGGASVVGNQTRTLNTVSANTIAGAALSGNQITLPAGTYRITARSPTVSVNVTQAYLHNVTANAVIARGSSENGMSGATGDPCSVASVVTCRVTLAALTAIELRQYCGEANANGLGVPASQGVEVYSTVEIIQE